MNILILHSSSGLYGSSRILITIASEFKRNGHSVTVILSENGPLIDELKLYGIETKIVRLGIIRRKYFSFFGIINRLLVLTTCFFILSKLVKQKKIDIIYSNTSAVLIGAITAKIIRIRHIWHVHEIIQQPVILCKLLAWLMKNCSEKVIVVSKAVLENWLKFLPDKSKFELIHNGINIEPFENKTSTLREELQIEPQVLVIGMLGMIHYIKGQEYFLRLAGKLHKTFPNTRFLVVGDAFPGYEDLANNLEKVAMEENITNYVHFLGFRKDTINVLNAIDILVLPSILPDSFPTVILEAMAAEKPVVATELGGALEMIIPNITGILIPINDSQKAVSLMAPLLSNTNLRIEMGKEGKQYLLSSFSLTAFQEKIIAAIQ